MKRRNIFANRETISALARKNVEALARVEPNPREPGAGFKGRQMIIETKRVFALAALIAATGMAAVELVRSPAQANPMLVVGGAAGYAGERIDDAFLVGAEMPPVAPVSIPMAVKGDVMPTAYEAASDNASMVVETRVGDSTSILVRMMGYTMAASENQTLRTQ